MKNNVTCAVTGAFGFTGRAIARRLLDTGVNVRSLTGHPYRPDPFAGRASLHPLDFHRPESLVASLAGVDTLYNTYWVRFNHADTTFASAVKNSRILFEAALRGGVRRIVHVSVSNPTADSPLPYFAGKARVEEALRESGLSHAILRPTVIFGVGDVLLNNIAWLLRNVPVFCLPGSGAYRLQPIFVRDVAELAVAQGVGRQNVTVDLAGPEVFTFAELVKLLAEAVGSRAAVLRASPRLALLASRVFGVLLRDVLLTPDELEALMADLLVSTQPPLGRTRLADYLANHADHVGTEYASELDRHFR